MNILKQVNTPFDSSWNALQKVYWPKLNLTICSVTKSVKSSNRRRWWRAIRSIKINLPVSTWSSDLEPKRQIVEQVKTYRLQKNWFQSTQNFRTYATWKSRRMSQSGDDELMTGTTSKVAAIYGTQKSPGERRKMPLIYNLTNCVPLRWIQRQVKDFFFF